MPDLFLQLESALTSVFGSMAFVALLIMLFFIIAFLFLRIDFKFAILFTSPLALAFAAMGWLPGWVSFVFWMMVITLGGFLFWKYFSESSL